MKTQQRFDAKEQEQYLRGEAGCPVDTTFGKDLATEFHCFSSHVVIQRPIPGVKQASVLSDSEAAKTRSETFHFFLARFCKFYPSKKSGFSCTFRQSDIFPRASLLRLLWPIFITREQKSDFKVARFLDSRGAWCASRARSNHFFGLFPRRFRRATNARLFCVTRRARGDSNVRDGCEASSDV
jgi:hypothetical protein